ncbi:Pvc16 family protein [Actinokineospora sp. HUAS TT18]|uniref:Pvc16 family protein n=1 Tax=Actinokineospora sp. HUAS TT18 TaxID=3447451 RepID=UPI003F52217E
MIPEVDDALCQLLGRSLPEGTAVRLDPPKPTWQTERPSKVIDLFLFGLRGDPRGRESGFDQTRDDRGAVIARREPVRRCVLSYLVTARAPKVGEEHLLLDLALRTVIFADAIPPDCLTGTLADAAVFLSVSPDAPGDLWSSLGMPARAAFIVSVSAPYVAPDDTDIAPPAEKLALRSNQDVPGKLAPAGDKRWVRT